MKTKLRIIKIGGNVIDDSENLDLFLANFARLDGFNILVHGGGKLATKLSDKLGVDVQLIDGRRITSSENLEVVTMVYAGLINKQICAKLQGYGCNAIGLSGADANCITSTKRPPTPINYGYVGDIKTVDTTAINNFLKEDITPVFCAITHDGNGQLLNTNADTIAAEVAIAMSSDYETELIYCFEKKGVLANVEDDNSVISSINMEKYEALKAKGTINSGMLPKMENCFHALKQNVSKVIIGSVGVIEETNDKHTTLTL